MSDFNSDEIYTVADFLSQCNKTIENNIPVCWLRGEISNLSRPASGHWYFSLKDEKAQLRCAMFRLNQRKVRFNPENGMAVLVRAAPTLYEVRGEFQVIIQHLEAVGVGSLQLAFEQLKNKLKAQGWFDPIHKKPLPAHINTIGVISSSNGAVIMDIIKVLNKRYPFADIMLFDCIVQGQNAAKKLANAVDIADKSNRCDVLIVARGGGSLEDLWAFNEEVLASAIFNAKTPIVSAIGHETDTTIADFVSDIRAPTPSAAAILVSPARLELLSSTAKLQSQLFYLSRQMMALYQQKLAQLQLKIAIPNSRLNLFSQHLDSILSNLRYHTQTQIRTNQTQLNALFERLKQHSPVANIQRQKDSNLLLKHRLTQQMQRLIGEYKNSLDGLNNNLQTKIANSSNYNQHKFNSLLSALDLLSPLNTLARGYSITTSADNKVLSSTKSTKIGDNIATQFIDGKIYAKIFNIQNN